ncbi:hypothetical protein COOONC_17148, partial [Cooperia oncophora]
DPRTNNLVQETSFVQPQQSQFRQPQPQPSFEQQQSQQSFAHRQPQTVFEQAPTRSPFTHQQPQTSFTSQPTTFTQAAEPSTARMKQIIPLTDGFRTRAPTTELTTEAPTPTTTRPITISRTSQAQQPHQVTFFRPATIRPSFSRFRRPQQTTFTSLNPTSRITERCNYFPTSFL